VAYFILLSIFVRLCFEQKESLNSYLYVTLKCGNYQQIYLSFCKAALKFGFGVSSLVNNDVERHARIDLFRLVVPGSRDVGYSEEDSISK
jgi:hypothetical protein